jgi:lysophospholipase L1-like esterase
VNLAYAAGALLARRHEEAAGRLLLVTYSTLIGLVLAEALARQVVVPPTGGVWPRLRWIATVAEGVMPGVSGTVFFSTNRYGLRGPDTPLAAARVRMLCVGGSATECLYVTDRASWPWLLQDALNARAVAPVLVENAGKSGHTAWNHDYLLREYAYAPRFEWVLVMAGFNDLNVALWGNAAERRRRVPAETLQQIEDEEPSAGHLALLRLLPKPAPPLPYEVTQDPQGTFYIERRARRRALLSSHPLRAVPADIGAGLADFREALRSIAATCRGRGQQLVFVTQPTLWRKDLPPELEALLWFAQRDSAVTTPVLAELMARYNQTVLDACREEHVPCIDLAAKVARDTTVFYDDCHFNVEGSRRVAAVVAEAMLPLLGGAPGSLRQSGAGPTACPPAGTGPRSTVAASASTAGENRNPCASGQPRSASSARCSSVSTPSAITSNPRL